ncbi:unnamed protein product, partial [Brugia pahangi]|uniref:Headcase domain-containing protein n=1 Tax=Brugia pahangi TaxID=6280 RepID=A0A0N4THU5_BRUPA
NLPITQSHPFGSKVSKYKVTKSSHQSCVCPCVYTKSSGMNYRCSWPNRPTTSPMTSCTCPHTFDHSSFPIRQVQSPTPVHTRCTFCTNAKNYTVDGKIAQLFGESTRGLIYYYY